MAQSTTITIRELTIQEMSQLLADKNFSRLKPETCSRCGARTGFTRKIFEITGVSKKKETDDEIQRLIKFHFKQEYGIDFIFFKVYGLRFFADSAACDNCGSTAITYDIEIDQDLIHEAAKFTGKSEAQIKSDLERIYRKLSKD